MSEHPIINYQNISIGRQRQDALDIMEAALHAINTKESILRSVKISGNILRIDGKEFNLASYRKIKVIGFGKASCEAASALELTLGKHISESAFISNLETTCQIIKTYHGTHPEPSVKNVDASQKIINLVKNTTADDLVIVVVSGGGSALLCWPNSECEQSSRLYQAFLKSGGDIKELNTIRKHISLVKGGGLAKKLYPATVLGLIFSDVPGLSLDTIASGPTFLDKSTVEDAQAIIDKYNLGIFNLTETPKDPAFFKKVTNVALVSNEQALNAMKESAEQLGYTSIVITEALRLDPTQTIKTLLVKSGPKTAIIAGGETRLIVPATHGKGGRNTHTSLEALRHLADNQIFISLASDGYDNCPAAGVIADQITKQSLSTDDIEKSLKAFDSFSRFEKSNHIITTGPTHANVADLYLLLTS